MTSTEEQLTQILRPNPAETDYRVSRIEGEVPRELHGTLYRNGPNQKTLPRAGSGALHLFDGDGFVTAIRFEDGTASVRGRFVETESFLREQREGSYCFGGMTLMPDTPLPEAGTEQAMRAFSPNTNVVAHSGRLFALVENAPPFELDPSTLASRGLWEYDGKMVGMSTTAHPKIDGRTGQMVIHGYQPVEPYVALYIVEPDGSVSLAEAIENVPWPSMMHDMAITENYVILPLGSIFFDVERLGETGRFGEAIRARPGEPMRFGIRERTPGSPTRWFEAPSEGYMFHPGNAYERDGKIFMDACTYADAGALLRNLKTIRSGEVDSGITAHPFVYEFDLAAGTCKETQVGESAAEFPRLDDRLIGYPNRFGYAATAKPGSRGPGSFFRSITKYDRAGGPSVTRPEVEGRWVGEPVFVPRTPDGEEDDGFVLNLCFDAPTDRSALEILDARALDRAPLARLWLDERIPLGFHGNWAPAE